MEDVSYTAQWTAAARCLETERDDGRLFEDPYARDLAEPRGFELLQRYQGTGVAEYIAIRTRYMDDAVSAVLVRRTHRPGSAGRHRDGYALLPAAVA